MTEATRRRPGLVGVWLFLAGTLVALIGSWWVSIWTDEAVTVIVAQRSLDEILALIQRIDAVHATYYVLMSGWTDLFGISPFALRLPSALAAGGIAWGVYALTRRLSTNGTALTAGVVAILLPRLAWAGIEARPFILSALLATWATYALVRACQRGGVAWWLLYAALATIGVHVNLYVALLLVGHAITVLWVWRTRRRVIAFFTSATVVACLSLPLLLAVRSQQDQLGGLGTREPVTLARMVVFNQFFLGETPSSAAVPGWFATLWMGASVLLAIVCWALVALAIFRPAREGDDRQRLVAIAAPWIVLPTIAIAGYSVLVSPIYNPRYFTFAAPAIAILIALGLRSLRHRVLVTVVAATLATCTLFVYVSQRVPHAKSGSDWGSVAREIESTKASGDAVYFAPRYPANANGEIVLTTRRIADSYPDAFAGLIDLTLVRSGVEDTSFDGVSRELTASDLADVDRALGVYSLASAPEIRSASDAVFTRAGFTSRVVWQGSSTVIVEYDRTS